MRVTAFRQRWRQGDNGVGHVRPRAGPTSRGQLHRRQGDRQWVLWGGVPGQAGGHLRVGGHQEGAAGQTLQGQSLTDEYELIGKVTCIVGGGGSRVPISGNGCG